MCESGLWGLHRCVDVVDIHVECAVAAVLSDDLSCSVDDDGADDRCEKDSSSEGGHMLVVVWSNLWVIYEIKGYVGYGIKYKFMQNMARE